MPDNGHDLRHIQRGGSSYIGSCKQNLVERCHCLEILAAAVFACTCASFFLDWKEEKGAVLIRLLCARSVYEPALLQGVCELHAARNMVFTECSVQFPLFKQPEQSKEVPRSPVSQMMDWLCSVTSLP